MNRHVKSIQDKLFSSRLDSLITFTLLAVTLWIISRLLSWGVMEASFVGSTAGDCEASGACWVFIKERFGQLMFGFYDPEQRWRPLLALGLLSGLGYAAIKQKGQRLVLSVVIASLVLVMIIWIIIYGSPIGLPVVETDRWGGLMLTMIVSSVGILFSLPLGILLALGRRSELFVIRITSVIYIELWRGVPLITVLFMASVMLPLFLPDNTDLDKLVRCLVGVALFSSAYMAEVVRGGLQSISKGQYEAAYALGLSYSHTMMFVVLPQALRNVLPGIVNTFIGLFKDTTLVLIVGLFDLLGVVQASLSDPEWLGFSLEGYVFAAAIFWVFCYGMSFFSQKLEKRQALY